ncbi:MAG: sugar phosphate isomerase/epimerase, partial [Acidobacteriota bacterium]|nr:sugar phosphate isomerase/epimerase [Acidobacteriota bacterium]
MRLGVFTVLFGRKPFEEMLDYVVDLGIEAVEIGTGAYPGDAYCKPGELLASGKKLKAFKQAITRRGLTISALSCHGNPLHPQKKRADADHRVFADTLQLAKELDVETVIT